MMLMNQGNKRYTILSIYNILASKHHIGTIACKDIVPVLDYKRHIKPFYVRRVADSIHSG